MNAPSGRSQNVRSSLLANMIGPLRETRPVFPPDPASGRFGNSHHFMATTYLSRTAAAHHPVPWWLWCNVLSLDAPLVALLWAVLFARTTGFALPFGDATALFLAVWIIYGSDRLLDSWPSQADVFLPARHLFCRRHRILVGIFLLVASGCIFWLVADRMPSSELLSGIKLGGVLLVYMAAIHSGSPRITKILPKEIVVGVLFAFGVSLPVWSRISLFPWHALVPWALFASLCSLNCVSIECWEHSLGTRSVDKALHPFIRRADTHLNRIAGAVALTALIASVVRARAGLSISGLLAISFGALLLLILNTQRNKLSPAALRVLADVALALPPAIALLFGVPGAS
jgi:hypothetical protein